MNESKVYFSPGALSEAVFSVREGTKGFEGQLKVQLCLTADGAAAGDNVQMPQHRQENCCDITNSGIHLDSKQIEHDEDRSARKLSELCQSVKPLIFA
jgi:hypothetical protein